MRPWHSRKLADGQKSELVVAARDGAEITVIYETSDLIEAPNWSLDRRWLIYNADGRIFRISPDGQDGPHRINTTPVENLNNDHVLAPDRVNIYLTANDGHLYICPLAGGRPQKISNDHPAERPLRYYLHGVSPDGETLAYVGLRRCEGQATTWICTIPSAGGDDQFLTDGACPVDGPEFSADGGWIYFNSEAAADQPGHAQIFRMCPDGSDVQQLTDDARVNWFPHAAPDGSCLSYISFPPRTEGHPPDCDVIVRTMSPNGGDVKDIDHFHGGQGSINVNSWSPDSTHFAYVRYPISSG